MKNRILNLKTKNLPGFTLIELLVVVGVMAIIGGIASDLFISILKGANKANVINEVKQNGNLALEIMERNIRNATTAQLGGPTYTDSNFLILQDQSGNYIQFHIYPPSLTPKRNGYITMATGALTSDNIIDPSEETSITNMDTVGGISILAPNPGEYFTVTIPTPPPDSPPYVTINFRVAQGEEAPSRQDYTVGENGIEFQTTVSLRTY